MQSGFPIGVSQNTNNTNLLGAGQRPNIVPGPGFLVGGSITDRLRENPDDDLYLNPAAFTQAPAGTFGNAPRICRACTRRGATRPTWRSTRTSPSAERARSLRLEIINLFDNPWYAALAARRTATPTSDGDAQGNYSRTMQVTARFSF